MSFGAKGDGKTDDFSAIAAANAYVGSLGGGTLYFPAGHYVSKQNFNSIMPQNNVEYYGDGYSTFLDFTWDTFFNPNFGTTTYAGFTYYPANDITAGDRTLTAISPIDAANFVLGDMVMACSTTSLPNAPPGNVFPYFIEVNRVLAVNQSTGVLTLEDSIADGWSGVKIAKVTSVVACNFTIRDMRVGSNRPFAIHGSYKATIRNCWAYGTGISINGLVRSTIHDIIWTHAIATGNVSYTIEIETGSHEYEVYNLQFDVVNLDGVDSSGALRGINLQEFSRRGRVHDITIRGAGVAFNYGFVFGTGGGHQIERVMLDAASISQVLSWGGADGGLSEAINALPFRMRDIFVRIAGNFHTGVFLGNGGAQNLSTENVYIDGFHVYAPNAAPVYAFILNGVVKNSRLSGLIISGPPQTGGSPTNVIVASSDFGVAPDTPTKGAMLFIGCTAGGVLIQ